MIYKDAVRGATLSAMENPGVTMVVVHSPLDNMEENGVFGYCPESAVSTLFRFGEKVEGYRYTGSGIKRVQLKSRTSTTH
jgi:hypothetical protein